MKELIENLLKLQSLEFDGPGEPGAEKQIAKLRAKVPPPVLAHYDRLVARGKKGVAIIRHQVCTGCHVQVPRNVELTLMHDQDLQLCENCGRYLYLPEQTEAPSPAEPAPKTPKPPRGRKALLQAA